MAKTKGKLNPRTNGHTATELLKLNLASGQRPIAGWVNVDIVDIPGVDNVWDLRQAPWHLPERGRPWHWDVTTGPEGDYIHNHVPGFQRGTPWYSPEKGSGQPFGSVGPVPKIEDESVSEAMCSHFFEHLSGPERVAFMEELWRVLGPGGKITIITPYWNNLRAHQDPYHVFPPVTETSYLYFNKGWRDAQGLNHYPITCDFDYTYGYEVDAAWGVRTQDVRDFAIKHYANVVNDLQVTLTKRDAV